MSALLKLLTGLVEGLLAKLGLLLLALEHALQRVLTMLDNDLDVWLPLLARLAGDSDLARETFVHWLLLVWQALSRYWLALLLVLGLAVLLFGVALVHGGSVIPEADLAALPDARRLRWTAVLLMAVPLLLGAVLLLPLATWLVLVARSLWKQLGAARRAALRVRSGEFARADWVDVVPGMRPGQPLYEALWVAAPRAHHEAVAGPGR